MAKIHITRNGMPGECKARVGNCPLGGPGEHYDSLREAVDAIEALNKAEEIPAVAKKVKPVSVELQAERWVNAISVSSEVKSEVMANPEAYRVELENFTTAQTMLDTANLISTAAREVRREQSSASMAMVRRATESYAGTTDLPQPLRDQIWAKAWEDGHASGFASVSYAYEDIADYTQRAYEFGRKGLADNLETYAQKLDTGLYPTDTGVVNSKQDKDVARKIRQILAGTDGSLY